MNLAPAQAQILFGVSLNLGKVLEVKTECHVDRGRQKLPQYLITYQTELDDKMREEGRRGWSAILSGLKTPIESAKPLPEIGPDNAGRLEGIRGARSS
jgi:hypothetical protein